VSILATRGATPFSDLRALLSVTQGNLGSHLQKLEEAGYVSTEKSFVDRKPQTLVRLTPAGRAALLRHVKELQRVLRRMD
jgi:DNA-binding MarR family transcriptional regulator